MDEHRKSERRRVPTGPIRAHWVAPSCLLLGLLAGLAVGAIGVQIGVQGGASSDTPALAIDRAPRPFEQALREPDSLRRAAQVAVLLERLDGPAATADDAAIAALRRVFEGAPIPDGDVEFALFGAWWARIDPAAAFRWASIEPRAASISVLTAVLDEWSRQDPFAAVQAARLEALDVRRHAAFAAVLRGAGPGWEDRLGDVAGEIEEREERRAAARAAATLRLRSADGSSVIRWARAMPTAQSEAHADFVAGAAMAVARVDPGLAIEALASQSKETEAAGPPEDVIRGIAAIWSEQDPAATIEWLATLAPGETATDELSMVVREAYQRWVVKDREAALAWVAQRDAISEAWFDPIRATAGLIVGQEDPVEGLRMLSKLPIARERALKVQNVFTRWKQESPDAAERWLLEADLPEERKQELREVPVRAQSVPRQQGS